MRWRDIKRGKCKPSIKAGAEAPTIKISPIADRIKAFLTDSFMIFMPIIYTVFYIVMGSREEFRAHMFAGWIYILIPHFVITTLFLYFKGQTPGYKAYSIKLLSYDRTKPSFIQIATRYIVFTITLFIFPLTSIPFFTSRKLGLQDFISRTLPTHVSN